MRIFQALLVSYIITGILLLVLAVLLYKLNLDKGKVTAGITGIYVVSAFAGGFLIGKLQKVRKFIWGSCLGFCISFCWYWSPLAYITPFREM